MKVLYDLRPCAAARVRACAERPRAGRRSVIEELKRRWEEKLQSSELFHPVPGEEDAPDGCVRVHRRALVLNDLSALALEVPCPVALGQAD